MKHRNFYGELYMYIIMQITYSSITEISVLTQSELRVSVDNIVAANVDEFDAVRVEHLQRRVHIVDVMHAHATTLPLL